MSAFVKLATETAEIYLIRAANNIQCGTSDF